MGGTFFRWNDPGLGKLTKARRNNYAIHPATQTETNFWIEEKYSYEGLDGRVSQRESVCHPYKLKQWFTYDNLGGIKELVYPQCEVACVPQGSQGRTVSYTYDLGRVTRVADANTSTGEWIVDNGVTFNSNGTWATIEHSNQVTDHQTIDPSSMRRPGQLHTTGVTSEQNWDSGTYAYDGSGNITAMGSDAFAYDKVSRIVESTVSGETQDYTYDAYGNLTSITTNGQARSVPASASTNRLSGHTYDDRGNLKYWAVPECLEYCRQRGATLLLRTTRSTPTGI